MAPEEMPEFQQRVHVEKSELDAKIDKLRSFHETATFANLGIHEQGRLTLQLEYMCGYSRVLGERIAAFR